MPNADFTPSFNPIDVDTNYGSTGGDITVPTFHELKPFRFWCQKALPLVYDDSLSYYELLCKVVDYLNNMMTDLTTATGSMTEFAQQFVTNQEFLNNMAEELGDNTEALQTYINERMEDFTTAYEELQDYVNDYFANLDITTEINNKLDTMAQNGTLSMLLEPFTEEWLEEKTAQIDADLANQNQTLANQNGRISVLESRMDGFSSLPAGSTSGNAELVGIRTNFLGEVYSTAGDAVRVSDMIASGYESIPFTVLDNWNGNEENSTMKTIQFDVSNFKGGKVVIIANVYNVQSIIDNAGAVKLYASNVSGATVDANAVNYQLPVSTTGLSNPSNIFRRYAVIPTSISGEERGLFFLSIPSDFNYQYIKLGNIEKQPEGYTETQPPQIVYATNWSKTPIDSTLSVSGDAADAKATGDAIDLLKTGYTTISDIKQGSMSSDGEEVASTTRLHVVPQKVNSGDILKINTNLYYGILIWTNEISQANVIRNDYTNCPSGSDEVTFISDGYFAMTFRKEDSTNVTPSDFNGSIRIYKNNSTETTTLKQVLPSLYNYGYYYNADVGSQISLFESPNFNCALFNVKPNTAYKLQAQGRNTTSVYFQVIDSSNILLYKFGYQPSENGEIIEMEYVTPANANKIIINCTAGPSPVAGKSMQYAKLWELKTDILQANYRANYSNTQKENMLFNLGLDADNQVLSSEQFLRALGASKLFIFNDFTKNIAQNQLPTFVQVSDVHGDAECFNFAVDAAETINADAVICTGDVVYYYSTDSSDFVNEKINASNIDFLPCIGNHDSYVNTAETMYNRFIKPFETGLVFPQSVDNPTYYYKDFSDKKIRVICVNQFEYRGVSNYSTQRNYTQEQIDFFCNALITTPSNYGIIVLMHTPEKSGAISEGYTKFYQTEIYYDNTGADIYPIYEIVDAFISGTTINKTWNNIEGNTPTNFTANADFSNKNNGVEFIAYMTGHMHRDCIYYIPGMINKQLMLNVTCTCHWSYRTVEGGIGAGYPYFTESGDLPRVEGTPTQNAINVYGIDRNKKCVKIARIGSEMPYDMDIRDYMVIPYKDI